MALSDHFDFFQHHKDLGNIYFDADMALLRKHFDALYDIFSSIRKRHDRHDTQKVAKSVFDYVSAQDSLIQAPSRFYQFRSGDVYVYASRVKDSYVIAVDGLYFTRVESVKSAYTLNATGSIICESLDDLIAKWPDVVSLVCNHLLGRLV